MAETTFSVAASGDDGQVKTSDNPATAWPPAATVVANTDGTSVSVRKLAHESFDFTEALVALMRFDTSTLSDTATVTAATLRLNVISKSDINNRSVIGEWYATANWPIDDADYTLDVGTDAIAGTDITGITAGADNDFVLSNPGNVSLTGYTAFRLGVSGGDPGQPGDNDNRVAFASFDHATLAEPRLIVTWTVPAAAEVSMQMKMLRGIGL